MRKSTVITEKRSLVEGEVIFSEIQKVSPWFAIAILFSGMGVGLVLMLREIFFSEDKPIALLLLLGGLVLFIFGLVFFLARARLETFVSDLGIYVRYAPFQQRFVYIPKAAISRVYLRNYDAFSEYGGTGIKGTRRNLAYSVNSSDGLQIELTDGSKLLIGTEQVKLLSTVLLDYSARSAT